MSRFSKQIVAVAESEMSRNALNRWPKFALPEPNEEIDALVDKLAHEDPQDEGDQSGKHQHERTSDSKKGKWWV